MSTGTEPRGTTPDSARRPGLPSGPGEPVAGPDGLRPQVLSWCDPDLASRDPLEFPGYHPPTPQAESVRVAVIDLAGRRMVWIDCDFARVGGTMGVVAGERVVRAFDSATATCLPVVATVSSGGARLQEGMAALLQMPRTVAAVARHRARGLPYVAYLRSPVTGGVYASWVSAADLLAAEPEATIGFGGPRVVEAVTGQPPPAHSHTAAAALRHGLIDALVEPARAWHWIAAALGIVPAGPLTLPTDRPGPGGEVPVLGDAYAQLLRCRDPRRASGVEWAARLSSSWVELAGAEPTVRAGLAVIGGRRAVVIATDRHAGSPGPAKLPGPEGFRLARRAIELAGRRGLPVLSLVDTPGADPGPQAEAAGIAREISATLLAMAQLPTVSVALVVGEGGSGGALALAHADVLLMLSGAVFSVIGPQAGAAVLYRDPGRAAELARNLLIGPQDLLALGAVSAVLPEDPDRVGEVVARALGGAPIGLGAESGGECEPDGATGAGIGPGARDARPDAVTARCLVRVPEPPHPPSGPSGSPPPSGGQVTRQRGARAKRGQG